MRQLRSIVGIAVLGGGLFAMGCGDPVEPDPDPDPDPTVASAFSGDGQSALAGETLSSDVVVRVAMGATPVSGASVTWAVTAGGGSVDPTTSTTNSSGQASTTWTLGAAPGTNTVQASVAGATGSPVTFSATGTDPTPPNTASIQVQDNSFNPEDATIATGGTVTWTWGGSNNHNVTFTGAASATQPSGTYQRMFDNAGDFDYQCTIHPTSMTGTITVVDPPAP